jgi:[NiFe] hydrogenase assembly HybE family chaperone
MTADPESFAPQVSPGSEDPAAKLERVFRHIAGSRMAGISILNPALKVEAVGFRRWRGDWVGILITPWFMSLICLPGPDSEWEAQSSGSKRDVELPSGTYEFLAAHEDELGSYLTSSLFSPMFDFSDMVMAREAAATTLAEMFAPTVSEAASVAAPPVGLTAKLEQPVSRRRFFGSFLHPGEKP